jgi:acetyl-CoA C-acetyltransferase
MTLDDIDLWEIHEVFAAVPRETLRDLDLAPEKVNANGSAIALGHPFRGTGPMLVQTALDELERQDQTTAPIAMCTRGGMGMATIIQRLSAPVVGDPTGRDPPIAGTDVPRTGLVRPA